MKRIIFFALILFTTNLYSQVFDKGKLNEKDRINLIEELSNLTGFKIDPTKIIVINFYLEPETEPNGSCIDHYTNDSSYKRFVKRNKNISQFFITQKEYVYKKNRVIEDKNDLIRKVIFEKAEQCGNFFILMIDGEFIRKYGEYRQDEIPKLIKLLKTK